MSDNTLYKYPKELRKELLEILRKIKLLESKAPKETESKVGSNGREVELRTFEGYIQWRYINSTWINLISIAEITGPQGIPGTPGTPGGDGQEIQLRVDSGYIQWKYEDDVSWTNLVLLEDLKGDTGETGAAGQSIHHTSFTSTTAISGFSNEPGETDTYTVWGDVGETINLGTFDVYNGNDGVDGTDGTNGTNGVGVPIGGTTGQVLAKKTDDDFDTEWITASIGVVTLLLSLSVDSWWGLGVFNFSASTIVLAE